MAIRMRTVVLLGIKDKIDLEFKWWTTCRKIQNRANLNTTVSQFYTCGDAAPGARFNFIYTVK